MEPILPMEPKKSEAVPEGNGWLAQIKWDGVRILTYFDGTKVRLYNRKLNERTWNYPELTNLSSYCSAESVILDGEVIAMGEDGKPSFYEVMRRDGIRRKEKLAQMVSIVPVAYMIFDVIYLNREWLNKRPLNERTRLLSDIIEPNEQIQLVSSHRDGNHLFHVIKENGMEGIVLKKEDSPYQIGQKTDHWQKVKNYLDVIAVVGGFTLRGGVVNAVLLGLYNQKGELYYIGHTGTGKLSNQEWRQLTDILKKKEMDDRPFINKPERNDTAHWVRPALTVKIQYAEWRPGHSLRQPSIQSFVDVPPKDCKMPEDGET
ncbi:bifunctional non-homologous end joining protein LigD [Scopulibacillus darangshiensis]|uniref:DNA ligase (ATP) n=1 Tax=Scopulibacillus darangshiensis TaxID=442528 RepID=A0A4R2P4N1_9BACL|nr:RNA ligase family protein [Scopulibacillus darangshiensis]TCP29779.1 bifunctional non-homologous end joining protein LigD [Scopulibacillus darangshiensis]